MDSLQTPTFADVADEDRPRKQRLLKTQQQALVDFKAVGGLITDDDGKVSKMTMQGLADILGLHRDTLQAWQRDIPDFWDMVQQRRTILFRQNRLTNVMNTLYLSAVKGDMRAIDLYYKAHGDYQPPSQKHEVTIGGLIDLARTAESKNIIEGEVVDGNNT